ncbi:MAG: oligosaccharide flippase family protein [Cytophagales bacterium]
MGIVKRQFFKASAATYVGVALGYLNITILFPYFCTPEQLGLYRVIINMATMFAAIAYMGTPQTIIKQHPFFKKSAQLKEFYGLLVIMFLATLTLSAVLLMLLENSVINFFSQKSPEVAEYYFYSVYIAFTLAIYVLFISNVRIIKRIAFPAFLKDVFLRVLIMINILLLGFEIINFKQFIILLCSAYTILTIVAVIYSLKLVPIKVSFEINALKKYDIKNTLNFTLLTFLASISNIIIMNADSLMITAYAEKGLTDTGIYTIAFFIGSTLEIPKRMIILVTAPVISEYWTDGKMDQIEKAFKQTSINGLILGAFIFGLIWLNIETLYTFIPNSEIYSKGLFVVLFILIARLFELICSLAPNIITQTKLYAYNLPLSIVLVLITIVSNYLLIPKYGILGAGIATMASIIIYNTLKIALVWHSYKIWPFDIKLFKFLIFFTLTVFFISQIEIAPNNYIFAILKSLMFLVALTLFSLLDNTSDDFKSIILKVISKIQQILWRER